MENYCPCVWCRKRCYICKIYCNFCRFVAKSFIRAVLSRNFMWRKIEPKSTFVEKKRQISGRLQSYTQGVRGGWWAKPKPKHKIVTRPRCYWRSFSLLWLFKNHRFSSLRQMSSLSPFIAFIFHFGDGNGRQSHEALARTPYLALLPPGKLCLARVYNFQLHETWRWTLRWWDKEF